jgi:dihydrolipoyl dehydrogenase
VLAAVGRVPNTEGLGLDQTGVEVVKGAVKVDEFLRTAVSHIYAVGDVTNIMQLAHVASHQGMAVVDHILGKNHAMAYDAVPAVIFTQPEIAAVGVAQADPDKHTVSRFDFAANGKALVKGESEGFVKLIKEKDSGRIVGGVIIGPDASVMINTLTLAVKEKMSEQELTAMIFPHPTTGEALHEAAMGLSMGALHQ